MTRTAGLLLALAVSLSMWLLIYYIVGLLGLGILLMVTGAGWLAVCAALSARPKPPRFRVLREDRIGAFDKRGRMRLSRSEQRRLGRAA